MKFIYKIFPFKSQNITNITFWKLILLEISITLSSLSSVLLMSSAENSVYFISLIYLHVYFFQLVCDCLRVGTVSHLSLHPQDSVSVANRVSA